MITKPSPPDRSPRPSHHDARLPGDKTESPVWAWPCPAVDRGVPGRRRSSGGVGCAAGGRQARQSNSRPGGWGP